MEGPVGYGEELGLYLEDQVFSWLLTLFLGSQAYLMIWWKAYILPEKWKYEYTSYAQFQEAPGSSEDPL